MAGHSKWKNIMHKKGKTDAQRAKVFAKIGKEITVAVKEGGADPTSNSKLRDVIAKAKSNNVPNDNITRIITKASSSSESANYDSIVYEGYGQGGVAVIVEALTDNRNRTAGDLRHYFDKFGGNLGQPGSVSFMFEQKGVLIIEKSDTISEDALMELALELGAEDFSSEDDVYEIQCLPADFSSIRDALEKEGYGFLSAQVEMLPSNYLTITDQETITNLRKLFDALDDNDDVQDVWHNWQE